MKKIRWGIAGPGVIAHKFAEAIVNVEEAELVGVASRSPERADRFAKEFGIEKAFYSYEEMAASPEIDVVYISTAHPFHKECAELFMKAKKHILCEKPLCVDAGSATRMKACAEENGVFLMEAMWTAFLPAIISLQNDISKGVIGVPMGANADFCYSIERDEDPKLFENSLAGGSLLDVGVYCLYFLSSIMGHPVKIDAEADIRDGVDYHTQAVLKYENGAVATMSSAIKLEKPYDARIYGTKGSIYVPDFYKAERYVINYADGKTEEKVFLYGDNGFEFEIEEVCRCINNGKTGSEIMPTEKSIAVLKDMDTVRALIGLKYDL